MTRNKYTSILLSATAALALSSCSLFGGKGVVTKGDSQEAVTSKTEQTVNKKQDKTSPRKQQQRESALSGKINGEWVIVGVASHTISRDEDMPYINFDETDNRFYASNGCNVLNGSYELGGDQISFSQVLTTLKECPDIAYQKSIDNVLNDGVTVNAKIEQKGQETYMQLTNASGSKLLTLRRHNAEAINGNWLVTNIDGTEVNNDEVNLFIDVPELKVHGNTGCNFFNGGITLDPLMPNSIAFSQMAVTMRMCPNSDTERAYLVALEEAASYKLTGNTLQFLNSKGKVIITFKKL